MSFIFCISVPVFPGDIIKNKSVPFSVVPFSVPYDYDGDFHNLTPISVLSDDSSTFSILMNNFFSSAVGLRPEAPFPTIKTALKELDKNTDQVLWFGHSSCFVQLEGKTILIDPVFSDYASPLPFFNKAFEGTNMYTADDMPDIDFC